MATLCTAWEVRCQHKAGGEGAYMRQYSVFTDKGSSLKEASKRRYVIVEIGLFAERHKVIGFRQGSAVISCSKKVPSPGRQEPFPPTSAPSLPSYLAFHLTLPTHLAQSSTSSLSKILSTVNHSLANSSFPAMRCTKLWHALHNQATLFNFHSSCHPLLRTLACTSFGMRWWYVSGIQWRSQISQASARVSIQRGGGVVAVEM